MILRDGYIIGNYRIVKLLGKGGMGEVYLVRHETLGVEYAMKVLKPETAENAEYVARFLREGKLASRIRHPNLIAVYDAGRDVATGMYYLVMDYVSGGTLEAKICKEGAIPPQQALKVVRQVAQALEAAAAHGMVHRDIKPANIMFDAEGRVRLADLGIAKGMSDEETTMTRSEAVFGTPAYMSPEQARDTGKVDGRSDIYSLGVVLWHALTGERPYAGAMAMAIIVSLMDDKNPLPDVRQKIPSIPVDVAKLVQRMCEKNVERRIQSPQDLIRRIDGLDVMSDGHTLATCVCPPQRTPSISPQCFDKQGNSRRKTVLFAVSAVLLAVVALIVALHFSPESRTATHVLAVEEKMLPAQDKVVPAHTDSSVPAICCKPFPDSEDGMLVEHQHLTAEEEARRNAEVKQSEEAKRAEEARRLAAEESARRAEAERQAAEQRRLAEEIRQAAERKRLADEARQAAERKRLADEARQTAERKRLAEEAQLAAAAMANAAHSHSADVPPVVQPSATPAFQVAKPELRRDYAKLALAAFKVGNWSLGYQYACQDETGNAEVLLWLGKCFDPAVEMPGFRHKKDVERAQSYYRRAAERGNATARNRLGGF